MDLRNIKPSRNFVDKTSINDRFLYAQPNVFTGAPPQRPIPEAFNWYNLSDAEKRAMRELDFDHNDILLMRAFKADPEAIIKGWNLLKPFIPPLSNQNTRTFR